MQYIIISASDLDTPTHMRLCLIVPWISTCQTLQNAGGGTHASALSAKVCTLQGANTSVNIGYWRSR